MPLARLSMTLLAQVSDLFHIIWIPVVSISALFFWFTSCLEADLSHCLSRLTRNERFLALSFFHLISYWFLYVEGAPTLWVQFQLSHHSPPFSVVRFPALHMASGGPRNMSSSQAHISHQKAGWLLWFLDVFSKCGPVWDGECDATVFCPKLVAIGFIDISSEVTLDDRTGMVMVWIHMNSYRPTDTKKYSIIISLWFLWSYRLGICSCPLDAQTTHRMWTAERSMFRGQSHSTCLRRAKIAPFREKVLKRSKKIDKFVQVNALACNNSQVSTSQPQSIRHSTGND